MLFYKQIYDNINIRLLILQMCNILLYSYFIFCISLFLVWEPDLTSCFACPNNKMTKITDDQNVRRQKFITTKMEDEEIGRHPKWKMSKI